MIRWICHVKPSDKTKIGILQARLGLCDLRIIVRERRLRWFGHVTRSSGQINSIQNMPVSGQRGPLRNWKTWAQCVTKDLKDCGLTREQAHDRDQWRSSVRNCRLEPTSGDAVHADQFPQNRNKHPQDGNTHGVRGMHTHSSIKNNQF